MQLSTCDRIGVMRSVLSITLIVSDVQVLLRNIANILTLSVFNPMEMLKTKTANIIVKYPWS